MNKLPSSFSYSVLTLILMFCLAPKYLPRDGYRLDTGSVPSMADSIETGGQQAGFGQKRIVLQCKIQSLYQISREESISVS